MFEALFSCLEFGSFFFEHSLAVFYYLYVSNPHNLELSVSALGRLPSYCFGDW